jgi:hypothetical protein
MEDANPDRLAGAPGVHQQQARNQTTQSHPNA